MKDARLDEIREDVLRTMDRHARLTRAAMIGAATLELIMLASVFVVIDWRNETHLLVFVLSMLGYSIVVLGLVALGAHVSRIVAQLAGALRTDILGGS